MATPVILAVGRIEQGVTHWRVAPPASVVTVTDADVDALIDELYGKPGLGVMDSAGLFDAVDPAQDAYELGGQAFVTGTGYNPPSGNAEHDAWIRGYNDAWAAQNSVNWWRKSERER